MTEVRKHQRVTASGKRTTVRHHTRGGERARQREDEAEAAREAWADRNAPHVSSLTPAEPEAQAEEWWADDDEGGDARGHTFHVNRAPAYRPQGDYDFAGQRDEDTRDAARQLIAEREAHDAQWSDADEDELEARTALMFEDAARRLEGYKAEDG